MSNDLGNLYYSIAQELAKSVLEKWEKIILDIEFFGDAAEFEAQYITSNGMKYFITPDSVFDYFKELNSMTTENQKNNWNRAKFTLEPDGNFDIEFEWDQGLADEIERLSKED